METKNTSLQEQNYNLTKGLNVVNLTLEQLEKTKSKTKNQI
jgi:hypothetical protein